MSTISFALQEGYRNINFNLPRNALSAASTSFFYSGAFVTLISGGNVGLGACLGGVAATVSLVDSIGTAIIKSMFPEKRYFEWYENFFKSMVSISLVNTMAFPLIGYKVMDMFFATIINFFADFIGERQKSIETSRIFFLI
jgi:hypothetical protein